MSSRVEAPREPPEISATLSGEKFEDFAVEPATFAVWSTPPESSRSSTPSAIFRLEFPSTLKRRELSETGAASVPVKPDWSEMFSALFQEVTASLASVVTATMFAPVVKLPVAVAKLVLPEPSVTVVAAPSTPTSPVNTSFRVVVVMPLVELWVPDGRVKRKVPPSRERMGPRLSARDWPPFVFRPMAE